MAIQPGTQLGPYEVVSGIGAGGMGEVYRACDFKLGRDVAIKVLPEAKPKGPAPPKTAYFYGWDGTSDGEKFIFAVPPSASGTAPPPQFTVVLNWPSLLKK